MISRLRNWRNRVEDHFVDRWPPFVLFGVVFVAPIVLGLVAVGLTMSTTTSIAQNRPGAATMVPDRVEDQYIAALQVVQEECRRSHANLAGDKCFARTPATSAAAVQEMARIINKVDLQGCHREEMPATHAYRYDYFSCRGEKHANLILVTVWLSIAVASAMLLLSTIVGAIASRDLIPRYHPNLWLTPYIFLVTFLSGCPLIISILTFRLRTHNHGQIFSEAKLTFAWLALSAAFIAAIVAADLRTFEPERSYVKGMVTILILAPIAVLVITLSVDALTGNRASLPVFMLDVLLLAGILALLVYLLKRPQAPQIL